MFNIYSLINLNDHLHIHVNVYINISNKSHSLSGGNLRQQLLKPILHHIRPSQLSCGVRAPLLTRVYTPPTPSKTPNYEFDVTITSFELCGGVCADGRHSAAVGTGGDTVAMGSVNASRQRQRPL